MAIKIATPIALDILLLHVQTEYVDIILYEDPKHGRLFVWMNKVALRAGDDGSCDHPGPHAKDQPAYTSRMPDLIVTNDIPASVRHLNFRWSIT